MNAAVPSAGLSAALSANAGAAYHALTVARVIAETADATSVEFDIPPALAQAFEYRPGQFLTLRVAHPDGVLARCYSLSSSPGIDARPRVTIKRVAGGRASNWLCDSLREGAQVEVLAPAGVFTPSRLDGDFGLLAGGSGITPMLSIIKAVLARGDGRIWLLYANRDAASVIFRAELQALAAEHPQRLMVQHWLDDVQGVPATAQLQALLARQPAGQYFICGPKPFMDGAQAALKGLGVARERVRVERFVSLDAAPAAAANPATCGAADAAQGAPAGTPAGSPADAVMQANVAAGSPAGTRAEAIADGAAGAAGNHAGQGAETATVSVTLDGAGHVLEAAMGASLLDSLLAAGVKAPHSCRLGSCGACMCKVEQGSVTLRANAVLDEDDLAEGWTLACQGVPASAEVRLRFPD